MRKKILILIAILIAAGLGFLAGRSGWSEKSGDWFEKSDNGSISIGVLVPLTGAAASYGQNSQRGAELALQEFRAANPSVKVRLQVEDSRGEASVGVNAAQKLVEIDGVTAVMGDVTSGVTLAVAPLMNERKIPLVSPGASAPKVSDAGDFVFRTWPSDTFEAGAIATYIKNAKFKKKLAILRVNNEYGMAMEAALRSQLGSDVKISLAESFDQGTRDLRTQLLKIKKSGAGALFFIGFPEAAVVLGSSYSAVGLSLPIFATSGFEDPQVPEKTGGVLNGTIYAKPLAQSVASGTFKENYKKSFGIDAGITSDTAYDATMLILKAVASAIASNHSVTGETIRDYLLHVRDYVGASGVLSFDANGDVVKPIGLFSLRDGHYEELPQ